MLYSLTMVILNLNVHVLNNVTIRFINFKIIVKVQQLNLNGLNFH